MITYPSKKIYEQRVLFPRAVPNCPVSHVHYWVLLKLLINTTRTAQYAAEAPNSSCLRALVRRDIAAEKRRVNTTRTPMALKVEPELVPNVVSLYIATTGSTSKMKIMLVMTRVTKTSTRALV